MMPITRNIFLPPRRTFDWVEAFLIALVMVVMLCLMVGCATKPADPTQRVYVAEVAFADGIAALGAVKSKIPPEQYARAKALVPCAQNVLYAAENAALNGDGTATTTNLCAFQTLLNQIAQAHGGAAVTTICPTGAPATVACGN